MAPAPFSRIPLSPMPHSKERERQKGRCDELAEIPRYIAVLKAKEVCYAKSEVGSHTEEYWRKHPKRLQDLVKMIRTGMSALYQAGHPEWGTAQPIPEHEALKAKGWKPGQYVYDEEEEKAVAEAFREKGEAARDDPRVTNSKWYKDYVGERVYWQQRQNAAIRRGEEILRKLGFGADGSTIAPADR